jgi:hypothetical protein
VLRPHVENHLGAVEQRFLGGGDLYLMHIQSVASCPWPVASR